MIDKKINCLPKYQQHIEVLKKEGYLHARVRLLQLIVDRLQE